MLSTVSYCLHFRVRVNHAFSLSWYFMYLYKKTEGEIIISSFPLYTFRIRHVRVCRSFTFSYEVLWNVMATSGCTCWTSSARWCSLSSCGIMGQLHCYFCPTSSSIRKTKSAAPKLLSTLFSALSYFFRRVLGDTFGRLSDLIMADVTEKLMRQSSRR